MAEKLRRNIQGNINLNKLMRIILISEGLRPDISRNYHRFEHSFNPDSKDKLREHIIITFDSKYKARHKIEFDCVSHVPASRRDGIYNMEYDVVD